MPRANTTNSLDNDDNKPKIQLQQSGPTRAYGKRSEFYKDDKLNHRLSK